MYFPSAGGLRGTHNDAARGQLGAFGRIQGIPHSETVDVEAGEAAAAQLTPILDAELRRMEREWAVLEAAKAQRRKLEASATNS